MELPPPTSALAPRDDDADRGDVRPAQAPYTHGHAALVQAAVRRVQGKAKRLQEAISALRAEHDGADSAAARLQGLQIAASPWHTGPHALGTSAQHQHQPLAHPHQQLQGPGGVSISFSMPGTSPGPPPGPPGLPPSGSQQGPASAAVGLDAVLLASPGSALPGLAMLMSTSAGGTGGGGRSPTAAPHTPPAPHANGAPRHAAPASHGDVADAGAWPAPLHVGASSSSSPPGAGGSLLQAAAAAAAAASTPSEADLQRRWSFWAHRESEHQAALEAQHEELLSRREQLYKLKIARLEAQLEDQEARCQEQAARADALASQLEAAQDMLVEAQSLTGGGRDDGADDG